MNKKPSFADLALEGVERMREKNQDPRGRIGALLLLLRGAYYTGEGKWRSYAEEDLRSLWRGGIHDQIGGGFFSSSFDREWLRPDYEKHLDDNAMLAFLYTEAWEKGRMGFHREAAESTLDWILRELPDTSGLYQAGLRAKHPESEDNPFLFTPEQIGEILGVDEGRHFAECYDITDEGNCGKGSIPNLILNQRWNLIPEGWDNFRERVRLARKERAGLIKDTNTPYAANALLLAALAKASRVFSDRRYLAEAEELLTALTSIQAKSDGEKAALLFALTEMYAADLDPTRLAGAVAAAPAAKKLAKSGEGLSLSLAALGYDALWRLTEENFWRAESAEILLELGRNPGNYGPEALAALCAEFSFSHPQRTLLCTCPEEEAPPALSAFTVRYAPDLAILLKTPARSAALAASAPWTETLSVGTETLFYPRENGKTGAPHRL